MNVFGDYAKYYNLLYRDEEYISEVAFVLERLAALGCMPSSLLDLGCGTGRHGGEMARRGVAVTGVDMSEVMLSMARDCRVSGLPEQTPEPEFVKGDACRVRLGKTFDAVTALFHVMSYQNTEENASALLATAKAHLKPGGIFLFDFWYGPGVLTDRPTERHRDLEDDEVVVRRHATPILHVNDNIVDVNYDIAVQKKSDGTESTLRETHRMRYWFMPELRHLVEGAGFSVEVEGAWLSTDAADDKTWAAWMAVRCNA